MVSACVGCVRKGARNRKYVIAREFIQSVVTNEGFKHVCNQGPCSKPICSKVEA